MSKIDHRQFRARKGDGRVVENRLSVFRFRGERAIFSSRARARRGLRRLESNRRMKKVEQDISSLTRRADGEVL